VQVAVKPIALSGTNSKVTNPIEIAPGNWRVSWQATDTGGFSELFEVYIVGQSRDNIVNEVLPATNHGEALFTSSGGQFIVEVQASTTKWKMTFTWLSP
jgi:hypothetical protein